VNVGFNRDSEPAKHKRQANIKPGKHHAECIAKPKDDQSKDYKEHAVRDTTATAV
jgi:hypothetical protein